MDLKTFSLDALDSATKYPTIPTYHPMLERGILGAEPQVHFRTPVYATEKVDGCNTRIILTGDSAHPFVVGSREELLWAAWDLVHNPVQGIVETVKPLLEGLLPGLQFQEGQGPVVVFGEVFGGLTSQAKRVYTLDKVNQFRIFDVAPISAEVLGWDVRRIARWRDDGGQRFIPHEAMRTAMKGVVPAVVTVEKMPTSLVGTYELMCEALSKSLVTFGMEGTAEPEGLILRCASGTKIAKVRFADYQRTLGISKRR